MALPQEQDDERNRPARRISTDQRRSRSVDWRSKTDPQDPYTRTTSNTYEAEQQKRLTGEQLLDREAADREKETKQRKNRRARRIKNNIVRYGARTNVTNPQSASGAATSSGKQSLKKVRTLRATWVAAGLCSGLYYYQVAFWILSMAGLGIEAILDYTFGEEPGIIGTPLKWILDLALPSEQVFVLGYLICTTIALIQLLITIGVYIGHGINPFRGIGFISLVFIFAFCWMPILGLVPWVYIWMYFLVREHLHT